MTAAPYTEAQAGEVWCPEVRHRYSGDFQGGRNRRGAVNNAEEWNCCIASRCAHWRWFDPAREQRATLTEDQTKQGGWTKALGWWERPTPNRRGYCGLSGKPEFEE